MVSTQYVSASAKASLPGLSCVQRAPFVSKRPGFAWRPRWSTERVYNMAYQRMIQVPGPRKTRVSFGAEFLGVVGRVLTYCSSGAKSVGTEYGYTIKEPAGRRSFVFSQLHQSDLCHHPAEKRPRLGLLHSKT